MKGDPVIIALKDAQFIVDRSAHSSASYASKAIKKAIAIVEQQRRVIEKARLASKEQGSMASMIFELAACKKELAALDKLENDK